MYKYICSSHILVVLKDPHLSSSSARVTDGLSNHFIDLQLFWNTRKVFLVKLEHHWILPLTVVEPCVSVPTHTFLHDGGSVVLVVFLFTAGGGWAELQAAAHLQDCHAGSHAHTWGTVVPSFDKLQTCKIGKGQYYVYSIISISFAINIPITPGWHAHGPLLKW